jgi:uncharacterized membrane protein
MTIRNPVEWGADQMTLAAQALRSAGNAFGYVETTVDGSQPQVRHIELNDLKDVLVRGLRDYGAYRTDVLFICLIFPFAGLVLARFTLSFGALPLIFPLVSGFALIGPFAAAGLYEMSRRQEQGKPISWVDAFGIFASPSFAAIIKLGLLLLALFALWLAAAMGIYALTLGPDMPTSLGDFMNDIFTTSAGWAMIIVGIAVGAVFALVALAISVVSFPLLLDRPVSVWTAISTSMRAVMLNPGPMLAWGAIVAASLVIGAIPALIGLIVVMPVLGHATWHLYRKVVVPRGS